MIVYLFCILHWLSGPPSNDDIMVSVPLKMMPGQNANPVALTR